MSAGIFSELYEISVAYDSTIDKLQNQLTTHYNTIGTTIEALTLSNQSSSRIDKYSAEC